MENINESRNSISTYIQCFTPYAIKKIYKNFAWLFLVIELVKMSQKREKLEIKTLTFEHKNNCLQRIKKEISKVALVSLKCSPRQSHFKRFTACSMTRSIVKLFSFLVFMYKYLFLLQFTTKFGVVEHKVSEIHSTSSRRFNYIYLNC